MKSKLLLTCVMAMSASLILASCGGQSSALAESSTPSASVPATDTTEKAPSSEPEADATSSEGEISNPASEEESSVAESSEEASSTEEVTYPSKCKVLQNDVTFIVGTTFDIEDYVEFTPEGSSGYTLTSNNEDVAVVKEDGRSVEVVGWGSATIKITVPNGSRTKVLANFRLSALTEEGVKIQALADSVSTTWRADVNWRGYEDKKLAEITDDTEYEDEVCALIRTPNYVIDWLYCELSTVRLQADGNAYLFNMLDEDNQPILSTKEEDGKEYTFLDYESVDAALAASKKVELIEKASANNLSAYFVIEELLDISNWTEVTDDDGNVTYAMNDSETAIACLGEILFMNVSSFKNGSAVLAFDEENNAFDFTFKFDGSAANIVDLRLVVGDAAKVDLLEQTVLTAEPPAPTDVTDLTEEFAKFTDNYVVDWEIGLFEKKTFAPLSGDILVRNGLDGLSYNTVGETIVNTDSILYTSADRLAADNSIDETTRAYAGWTVDTENSGIYLLEADEDGNIAKKETPVTGSEEINTFEKARLGMDSHLADLITADVLAAASLSYDENSDTYTYDTSKDPEMKLSALLATLCPFSYSTDGVNIFANPDNANYIEGYITFDPEADTISFMLFERVGLSQETGDSAYEGIIITLSLPGEAPSFAIGDSFANVFGIEVPEENPVENPEEGSSANTGEGSEGSNE